jgi:hypothetical protein
MYLSQIFCCYDEFFADYHKNSAALGVPLDAITVVGDPTVNGIPVVAGLPSAGLPITAGVPGAFDIGILRTVLYNETRPGPSDYSYRSQYHSRYIDIRVLVP